MSLRIRNIFIKFVLWLGLGISIMIIGISDVFAEQVNVGYIGDQTEFLLGIPNLGAPVNLPIQTNNSYGNIFQVWINVNNISLNKDYIYQVEISTPNSTFTNVNSVDVTTNGSQICNFLGFSDASINYPKFYFQCPTSITNGSLSISIYNNSGSTSSIVTNSSTFRWNYTYLRYFTDDDELDLGPVISNATNNTNNIINNQNQNTQDIINSNKVCNSTDIDKNSVIINNSRLNENGIIQTGYTNYGVTDYIEYETLELVNRWNNDHTYICFYNSEKTLISCSLNNSLSTGNINITNSKYFRATIYINLNVPTFRIYNCKNGNQALDDSINNLNDSLNNDDSSGATNEASDFFSSFTTNTFGLTSIITAPLNLIQSLTSSTCSTLRLPLPYLNNQYLELPCMSSIYSQYFGTFFTMYQTITYGIIAYWVIVRIFNQVKDFKNPEHDEIEVVDL